MESQVQLNNERQQLFEKFKEVLPALSAPEIAVWEEAYKDGALSRKTKRLMALAIGLRARCTNCILAQSMRALEAGATREEFLETISVVVAMSGSTGTAESLRVLQFLDEQGKL